MSLVFSPEQEQLRATVRRFLAAKSPQDEVRRLMDTATGFDDAVRRQAADQLGLYGLAVPVDYGGAGGSFIETMVVFEELGRVLWGGPYFSTVGMATPLLLAMGDESAKKDYLPSMASGRTIATVAFAEEAGRWDATGVSLPATPTPSGWTLTGEKHHVIDGHTAGMVLVVARAPGGLTVFAVEPGAPGFTAVPVPTLDQTRRQARLRLAGTPARLIGREGGAESAVSAMLDLAAVALAAEQVGAADQVLAMTVEYAKARHQFGQPIGSFQAIKHKCADMLINVESARAAAHYAGWSAATGSAELPVVASLAKAHCSDAVFAVAAECIQIHGGIGFTWEHPAHLYFKRAKSSQLLLGDPAYHRDQLVSRAGIDG